MTPMGERIMLKCRGYDDLYLLLYLRIIIIIGGMSAENAGSLEGDVASYVLGKLC